MTVITVSIAASADDAEESVSDGAVSIASSDLEIGYDSATTSLRFVGLRFLNLGIPADALITNAYVQFEAAEVQVGTSPTIEIYGQSSVAPATFTTATNDLTSRTLTTASVTWDSIPGWDSIGERDVDQRTPDISTVIQEIVDLGGWSETGDVVLVFDPTGSSTNVRTAKAWDLATGTGAASLHVTFSSVNPVGPTVTVTPGTLTVALPVVVVSSVPRVVNDRVVVDASTLTAAELVALIESESLAVDCGCDLLDFDDVWIADISDDLIADGSVVELGIYNTIHRTCTLNISRELAWGSQRLRPYLLLSADYPGNAEKVEPLLTEGGEPVLTEDDEPILVVTRAATVPTWYRFPLGVFVLTTPELTVGESPQMFSVQGYDKLEILHHPYGATYTLAVGGAVIAAVEALIAAAGETSIDIDQTAAATVAAGTMSYSIVDTEDWTTLRICNDLLESVGYRALYVDASGTFRSEPYRSPTDLPVVWSYSTASSTTTVGEYRTSIADLFHAANSITGVNDNPEAATIPVEGAGIYTLTNPADGPTSIAERGRTIRRIVRGTYANQSALETAVTAAMDAEKRITEMVEVAVSPNPVHGHFDVVNYRDDDLSVNGRYLTQSWTLPLDGSDMGLTLRAV